MIIRFDCPQCREPIEHTWRREGGEVSACVACPQCVELWGVVVDGDDIEIYETGDAVGAVEVELIRKNPSGQPTEADLRVFDNPHESTCDVCGMEYDDFRTGETFQSVLDDMWSGSEDPEDWNYKGRHSVLGRWHQIKQSDWRDHLKECEEGEAAASAEPSFIEYDEEEEIEY